MTKAQLKKEIKAYMAHGNSIEVACQKVNNLYHNEHLFKIYEIQQQLLGAK